MFSSLVSSFCGVKKGRPFYSIGIRPGKIVGFLTGKQGIQGRNSSRANTGTDQAGIGCEIVWLEQRKWGWEVGLSYFAEHLEFHSETILLEPLVSGEPLKVLE